MKDWQKYATDIDTNKSYKKNTNKPFTEKQLKIMQRSSLIFFIITIIAITSFCIFTVTTSDNNKIEDFLFYTVLISIITFLIAKIILLFKDNKSSNASVMIAILAIPIIFITPIIAIQWGILKYPKHMQLFSMIFSVFLGPSLYLLYYSRKKLKKWAS